MISSHLQATRNLEDAVKSLATIVEKMSEGLPKYRLQARVEMMQETAQQYVKTSSELYDRIIEFAFAAGR